MVALALWIHILVGGADDCSCGGARRGKASAAARIAVALQRLLAVQLELAGVSQARALLIATDAPAQSLSCDNRLARSAGLTHGCGGARAERQRAAPDARLLGPLGD
jgi:hypothetical protein